jgi:hypothetical protein
MLPLNGGLLSRLSLLHFVPGHCNLSIPCSVASDLYMGAFFFDCLAKRPRYFPEASTIVC